MMNGDEPSAAARERLRRIDPALLGWKRSNEESKDEEEEEEVPSHLNTTCQSLFLNVSTDKLSVQYIGNGRHENDVGAIRANCPAPIKRLLYYFEIHVRSKGDIGRVSIGFTDENFKNGRHPGWESNTFGYKGDDGNLYRGSPEKGDAFGPQFTTGDTVGSGINYAAQEIFFTKNGKYVGACPKDVKGPLFPTIGLHSLNEKVDVNFGQTSFVYDIEQLVQDKREKVQSMIEKESLPHTISHRIVRSYLLHYGYQDTLTSFDTACGNSYPSEAKDLQEDNQKGESYALEKRKMLRQFIRDGDVDSAISKLHEFYPQLLEDEKSTIWFLLHCQKYIELIKAGLAERALSYARGELSRYCDINYLKDLLRDCAALLAYEDPRNSSVGYLLGLPQRELVADAVNAMILTTNPDLEDPEDCLQSTLEKLLRQLSACCVERRVVNGEQGEVFSLQKILHGGKEKVF